nr:T9SS type A sorting domain-containing protein [candidate division KSB1 bacterium]
INDALDESDETFTIALSNAVNATLADNQGIGTIIDNDAEPTISISDEIESENVGTMTFNVTLSGASASEIRVNYQTNDGTAIAPGDYTSTSGTLTFPSGTTSGVINVPIIDDEIDENSESFSLNLSNPVNATLADNKGNGTINDNDDAPTISIGDVFQYEHASSMNFAVTLSATSASAVTVSYQTANGTATAPNDYTYASGTLTIPAGSTTATIYVPLIDDAIDENNEQFYVNLSNPVNATIADNKGIGTIGDNDQPPTISITDASQNENVGLISFTVSLSVASGMEVSVNYQTNDITAEVSSDYSNTSGTLILPAGTTSGTINVPIIDDNTSEANETFSVDLSNASNATIADNQGIGTIIDNDEAPTITISDESVNENVGVINFTVSISAVSSLPISVDYQTSNGSAVAPGDYTATSGTLTIPAGSTNGTIVVYIVDDILDENNENFLVNLGNPVNATILDNQGNGIIIDNEAPPTVSISDETENEDVGNMTFTVSLSVVSGSTISVSYQTSNGTANASLDYTFKSGLLTIPAGSTSATITVPILEDGLAEPSETFKVNLSNAVNATIADYQGIGTIIDNDPQPTVSISDETGNENAGNMTFTVSLSSVSAMNISVSYETANGTAIAPGDYISKTGSLTIPAGSTTGTISIPIVNDSMLEENENFFVNLLISVNATISDDQGVGTIVDNDGNPTITISDETGQENIGNMSFTVTLSNASYMAVSVDYQTNESSAKTPADYTTKTGTLTIPAGSTTGTIVIPIVDDAIDENSETFFIDLSNPVNATLADNQGVGTILDNDAPPSISISDETENENIETMTFTVALSGSSGYDISVDYQTNDGSAFAPDDFSATTGTLTIPAGSTTATFTVAIVDDALDEENENFSVILTNPVYATISDFEGIGTINDNDAPPTISISDETENENIGTMSFTVTLSEASGFEISVDYQTTNGLAVAPDDYTETSGTVTITAGSTTSTINIPILEDTISEANETFTVDLNNPVNATIADAQGLGTIVDNDGTPNFTISDETESENIGNMSFIVTLSNASVLPVSVDYQTIDGTAIAPGDYTSTNGTLTIPAGSTSAAIDVPIVDEAFNEDNETFTVNLSNPVNANIADNQGVGTINNDDAQPAISISDETESEDIGTMSFTVTMSAVSALDVSIDYGTNNNTAETPVDYTETSGTLTIPAGSTTGTINVPIINDIFDENNETFYIDLGNPVNATIEDNQGIGTINDNDAPPTTTISDEIESENVGNMTFTITLSGVSGLAVSVDYGTVNGTAVAPGDFTATSGTLTIPAGSTTATISIPIVDDAMLEANENFFINLSNPINTTIVDSQGSATIVDNDGSPNITISDETKTENIGNMSFTVTLSNASYLPVSVDFQTNNGTAVATNDYTTTSGSLTIQPGDLTGTINVPIIDDALDENNETFFVNLSNSINAVIADNQGIGTINDNDAPSTISINDVVQSEDRGAIDFTVSLSAASGLEINISYQTVNGTAVAPGDYTATSGVLVIPAGSTSGTISVPIIDDAISETNETFMVNLSNPVNAMLADNQGIGVINNNDPEPSLTISDETENEDVGTMNFTVTMSAVSELIVSVNYNTSNSTAVAPGDYTAVSGTLTIPAGSATGVISVPIIDDNSLESNETFTVNLTSPINASRADNQAIGTIVDNDGNPNISITDVTEAENVGMMNFTVTLSNASYLAVSVNYQTNGGSAEAPEDYTTTNGILTIPPGNTSSTIVVPIIDDAIVENNETFFVDLSNPTNANIVDNQGIGTIVDNDGTPQITISDKTASENIGTMNFTVTMSAASAMPVSVDFQTTDGSAVSPADYAAMNGTLTIPVGNTTGTINVAIFNDAFDENNENFTINLSNPVNADIVDNQAVGTINDDDDSPSISISDEIENENIGNMSFTVTLSAVSGIDVSVYYQTANGTAVAPGDYTAVNSMLTIPAGSTTGTINVSIINDGVSEPNETFLVNLVNPADATTTITDSQGIGTIIDNDGMPNITISDEIKNENIGTMSFTVSLSNASASTVTVNFQTANGTAIAPGDYTQVSGTLTLPAGSLTGTIHVPIVDDTISESNETFKVILINPVNATIADNIGEGTIVDNDGIPNIIISDETKNEDIGAMGFSVTTSSASASAISFYYQTENGTANAPGDYTAISGTLTIPAGSTSAMINVPIIDDAISESNETFFVNLLNPTNATIADNQATGTIVDNDGIPNITISDETENEDINIMSFTVTISSISSSDIGVYFQTNNSSAVAPDDYTATSGSLTIPAGSLTGTIDVQIIDDALDENNETFTVNLTNPSNASIADNQGVGTIVDNDIFPTLSISDQTENENVGNMSFTVTLSKTSVLAVKVDYQTNNGTAAAPGDYTLTTGTLTIPPGDISARIFVPIIDDNSSELNEIFTVNLNNPVYATIVDAQGVGTIIDNEDADGDGITDVIEGAGDRDGDGIADLQDYDPTGWIYLETTGDIVSGGFISITPAANVTIIDNGANGYYRFRVSSPGDYTLTYTPPQKYIFSSTCLPRSSKLDVEPTASNPYEVGNGSKDGTNNKLTNWICQANKYYFSFHLEPNDPIIINNNIPLQRPAGITLVALNAYVENKGIKISWTTEFEPNNAGFNIYRSQQENGGFVKINTSLIPAMGNAISGSSYFYFDKPEQNGTYYYRLESISLQGDIFDHGTVSVILTSVDIKKYSIPENYELSQNYPNPFNPETIIEYGLPKPGQVSIIIYDIRGQVVRTLLSERKSAGNHSVKWDGRDYSGMIVSSGLYLYSFKVRDLSGKGTSFSRVRRMILMK